MIRKAALTLAILAVLAVPVMVIAATPSPFKANALYEGKTSRGKTCRVGANDKAPCTMTMKPGRGGRTLAITLRTSEPCTDERVYRYDFIAKFPQMKGLIKADGRYSLFTDVDTDLGEGVTATSRVVYDGRFIRSPTGAYRTTGALRGTSTITFADGKTLKCASGKVTYTLRP